jgi:ankyrin repeat protein
VTTFAAAVFFFVVLHSILGVIYFYAPASGSSRGRTAESVWDERDCDRLKTLLAAGADPNERGRDALTPLMNAARQTEPACVRALIAAGADLEARDKFSDTALVQAVVGGRDDNARVLLDAGAKEFRVTAATGRPITPDAAPLAAVRDYIDAVHRGDFPAMARLMAHASAKRMEDRREDLPMWQSLRPKTFVVEEGWMTDDAATLTIRGATASGDQRVFYHVERQPDGWQIRKEWFP